VTKAAAAVMGLPDVGMMAAHNGGIILISSFEDRCPDAQHGERPDCA
jgi:hypothetical protein